MIRALSKSSGVDNSRSNLRREKSEGGEGKGEPKPALTVLAVISMMD